MGTRLWCGVLVLMTLSACPVEPRCQRSGTLGTAYAVQNLASEVSLPLKCDVLITATAELEQPDGSRIALDEVKADLAQGFVMATVTPTQLGAHRLYLHVTEPTVDELVRDVVVMRDGNTAPVMTLSTREICRELAVIDTTALCLVDGGAQLFVDGVAAASGRIEASNVAMVDGALWAWSTRRTTRLVPTDAGLEKRELSYVAAPPTFDFSVLPQQAHGTTRHGVVFGGDDTVWAVEADDSVDAGLTIRSLGTFPFHEKLTGGFAMADGGPVWVERDGPCVLDADGGSRCTSWSYQLRSPDRDGMWLVTSANEVAYARFTSSPAPNSVQIFRPTGSPLFPMADNTFTLATPPGEYPGLLWNGRFIGVSAEDLTPTVYPKGLDARLNRELQWSLTNSGVIEVRRR